MLSKIDCYNTLKWEAPNGDGCDDYKDSGLCKDGEVDANKPHWFGPTQNWPEIHCCACGKLKRAYNSFRIFSA